MFFHFFFNDPATTEIYTLSLHDALPISRERYAERRRRSRTSSTTMGISESRITTITITGKRSAILGIVCPRDRKSTRLNSSHVEISYAVFCLKKKNKTNHIFINNKISIN